MFLCDVLVFAVCLTNEDEHSNELHHTVKRSSCRPVELWSVVVVIGNDDIDDK